MTEELDVLTQATDPRAEHGTVSDESARRIAENEARFRDANERIEDAIQRLERTTVTLPFVCECGRARGVLSDEEFQQAKQQVLRG